MDINSHAHAADAALLSQYAQSITWSAVVQQQHLDGYDVAERSSLSVLATLAADGTKLPLYVVFSGATKQPPLPNLEQLHNRVFVSATKSGFVNTEVMLDYSTKVLSKHSGALLTLTWPDHTYAPRCTPPLRKSKSSPTSLSRACII